METRRAKARSRTAKKKGSGLYHNNGNKQSEATFRNGNYEGYYVSYHKNGQKFREGYYSEYQGNSYDGRKEGVWYQYDEAGRRKSHINTVMLSSA
jgi:antitoxin component YwqK of YwqJK toxin-antitoxin module